MCQRSVLLALIIGLFSLSLPTHARDDIQSFSIKEAFANPKFQEKLGKDIKFYFGQQKHGKLLRSMGEFKTNKKTNAFNKSDKQACEWVFLSALIQLQNKARELGGNAVIKIESNYKDNRTSSEETFRCGAGTFVAGTALAGTIVKEKR